jgi:hypothetical protein
MNALLPVGPDARWMLARDRSAWYPHMTLLHQRVRGQWTDPISIFVRRVLV